MRQIITLLVFISFFFCYLRWPPNNAAFVFEAEYEIITNTNNWLSNFTHPLILIGLLAQLLMLYCVLNKEVSIKVNTIAILLLLPLVVLFFVVGLLSRDLIIASSTLPYLLLTLYYFIHLKRTQSYSN